MKGREGSARNSLAKYRAVRREDARSGSPLDDELKGMVATVERDMQQRGRLVDLFLSRSSRRALLIVSLLALFQRLSAIATGVASVYYYMERFHSEDVDLDSIRWIPYACLLLYGVTYSLGIGFLPSTLVAELFPTNIKSYAGSVSAIMLAVTSFCVNKAYQAVADAWGVHVMFWIFTINSICCALFVVFFVFETKGKTFAEIQDVLHNKD
ncbi:hypothetical protein AAG570_011441 [Ranatra chinensis]|uniref:Major facilitator superfamily (MFS) profile domain-containing protein n=1 Tax=Ranatra chinensis TaxID=642074 RepID=A0ABD0YKV5_9HEMI